MMTEWTPTYPARFIDRRMRLTREHGLVYQNVRAFHGVIVRKNPDTGKPDYDKCQHAHNKASAARKCSERAAKRANRKETP